MFIFLFSPLCESSDSLNRESPYSTPLMHLLQPPLMHLSFRPLTHLSTVVGDSSRFFNSPKPAVYLRPRFFTPPTNAPSSMDFDEFSKFFYSADPQEDANERRRSHKFAPLNTGLSPHQRPTKTTYSCKNASDSGARNGTSSSLLATVGER